MLIVVIVIIVIIIIITIIIIIIIITILGSREAAMGPHVRSLPEALYLIGATS